MKTVRTAITAVLTVGVVLGIAVFVSVARPAVPGSTSPTPPLATPVAPPTPGDVSACVVTTVHSARVTLTAKNLAPGSVIVVVGVFEGYDAPRWNSADGSRPANASIHTPAKIYTPARIAVQEVVNGRAPSTLVARVDGGQIGCDSYAFDASPPLAPQQKYLFFITDSINAKGDETPDLSVLEAWQIDSQGVVITPVEGNVPLSDLAATIRAVQPMALPSAPPG